VDFEDAVEEALNEQAILFVGAGFTIGATNIVGGAFKRGLDLGQHFAALCALPFDTGLEDGADEFLRQKGRGALIESCIRNSPPKK
jgi:hypothetical protein